MPHYIIHERRMEMQKDDLMRLEVSDSYVRAIYDLAVEDFKVAEELRTKVLETVFPEVYPIGSKRIVTDDMVGRVLGDVKMVYCVPVAGGISYYLRIDMLEILHITEEELYEAVRGHVENSLTFFDMFSFGSIEPPDGFHIPVIRKYQGLELFSAALKEDISKNTNEPFYVLSCLNLQTESNVEYNLYVMDDLYNGGVILFFPQILKAVADAMGSDIVILPSSRKELLVLPKENDWLGFYAWMVEDVNQSDSITPDLYLSDLVFIYSRESGKFTFIRRKESEKSEENK